MAALATLLFAMPMAAQAATIQCPRSITEKPTVAPPHADWIVVASSGERPLHQAGIYIGIGNEFGAQVPDDIKKSRREEQVRWKMPSPGTEKYWLGCSYLGTTALLVMKLDPTVTSCVAAYGLLETGQRQRLKRVDCR